MNKLGILLIIFLMFLVFGCEKTEYTPLGPEDFSIKEARWDVEIEFDCQKCDKPVCEWDLGWELTYQFNPKGNREEAVCWYYVDGKIKVKAILDKNKIKIGKKRLFDPDLKSDCRYDHKVGLCCAYTQEELLNDKYVCKDVLLEALCP